MTHSFVYKIKPQHNVGAFVVQDDELLLLFVILDSAPFLAAGYRPQPVIRCPHY